MYIQEVQMINADQLSNRFTEARKQFQEEKYNDTSLRQCTACKAWVSATAQHWNDVGGRDTESCEMCWVESIVCFWVSEDEAAQVAEIGNMVVNFHYDSDMTYQQPVEYNSLDRSFDNYHGMGE
jgi:hypothetical protein